jgi:uncharacterized NAD-dependent epimerase/dehydratase family protein
VATARNLILHTDGRLGEPTGTKTAIGILRFAPDRVKAVLDPILAGRQLREVCHWMDVPDVPIVGSLAGVGAPGDTVVVGFAPSGGRLTPAQRELLLAAAGTGLTVLNGLHETLDVPNVVNLRAFDPADRVLAMGTELRSTRVLTVGTSSAIGKMTTTVLLAQALRSVGVDADWLPTGQTGVILRGFGHVVDSVPLDFAPGVVERDLLQLELDSEVVIVEGQGSLSHPAFGPSTFTLFHAVRPQWFVLCHRLGIVTHENEFSQPVPTVEEAARAHTQLGDALGIDSRLLGISLDSRDLPLDAYERERLRLESKLGVPCRDPVRDTVEPLIAPLSELEGRRHTTAALMAAVGGSRGARPALGGNGRRRAGFDQRRGQRD